MAAAARAETTGAPRAAHEEVAARTLREDVEKLRDRVASIRADAEYILQAAMRADPFVAAAAAAGFGFLLGGGLSGGKLALLAKTGVGLAATWLSEELLKRVHAQRAEPAAEEPR